jgi:O-antigen/teichoic acid export membrane protein/glycosyltransferase involved in cell wall biosynthesis
MSHAVLLVVAGVVAMVLLGTSIRRPALGCAALALLIPLTAGMPRGAYVPLLRVNEALLLVVAVGFFLSELTRRERLPFNWLDLAVVAFCVFSVLIPTAYNLLTGQSLDLTGWMTVASPLQDLLVYVILSRTPFTRSERRLFFNATMLASIPVAAVAGLELVNAPGVRNLVEVYYPTAPLPSWDTTYRPASLLGFYSAVGAFGLLNFLLALSLLTTRDEGYNRWWLRGVMGINLLGMLAADTYAPVLALPFGTVMALWVCRRVPWREVWYALPAAVAAGVIFWPHLAARLQSQTAGANGILPETLNTRVVFWQGWFIPALLQHGLPFGTGTVIPPPVPVPYQSFIDNDYLWQMFVGGVPVLGLFLLVMGTIALSGWSARRSPDPTRRAIGATCAGAVVSALILDTTSEYLTMTGVRQEFWMLVGVMSGLMLAQQSRPVAFVELRPPSVPGLAARVWRGVRRLAPDGALIRASFAVLLGFGAARLIGFLFQVVAGRLLGPAGYGQLTYALAVAGVLSVLLTTAPVGLSRFLSRHHGNRREQEIYYTNWLAVVAVVLAFSAAVAVAAAAPLGLAGWMLAGVLGNLLGVTALETYREIQRGLGRYTIQSVFYVLANVVQLVAVLALAAAGRASPPLFLVAYGLSSVFALAVLLPLRPLGLHWRPSALSWRRLTAIGGFARPVLLQAVFWNLWYSGDMILVEHLLNSTQTGKYAAAKAIANAFALVPTAISFVFAPRVARLAEREVRGFLARVLAFTAVVIVPMAVLMLVLAGPLTTDVFGGRYVGSAAALTVLTVGMAIYGLKAVLDSLWLGLGYPVVQTISAAAAAAATLGTGLWLIPHHGIVGAAVAFGAGATAQLVVAGAVTVWAFAGPVPRVRQLSEGEMLGEVRFPHGLDGRRPRRVGRRPLFLVAEEITLIPDEGYTKFARTLEAVLGRRWPLLLHVTRSYPGQTAAPLRAAGRLWEVVRAARRPEAREGVIVYLSRSSLTTAALVRSRVLNLVSGSPVAMVALQAGRPLGGRLLRWLAPDLLLLPTARECRAARAAGFNADWISGGVDLERFRPPEPGEKEALRRRWRVPEGDLVVLHVGHLKRGRNLETLLPLARRPGTTVLIVVSGQRGPESEELKARLLAGGVRLIEGYQPHIEQVYRLADCYAFTPTDLSDAVALPLSVLEALATNLPVVSPRFGALPEVLGPQPGLALVETPEQLRRLAVALPREPVHTRQLAQPYTWGAIADRLLSHLEELGLDRDLPGPAGFAVWAGRLRRSLAHRRGLVRQVLFGTNLGYRPRPHLDVPVVRLADRRGMPALTSPASDVVGLIDGPRGSALRTAAHFYGLQVAEVDRRGAAALVTQALRQDWPLLWGRPEVLLALPEDGAALAAFLRRGGTLYLDGLRREDEPALRELCRRLEAAAPTIGELAPARYLVIPPDQTEFGQELAGTRIVTGIGASALSPGVRSRALVFGGDGQRLAPFVVRQPVGDGQLVLSTLPTALRYALAGAFWAGVDEAGAALVPMLLLRGLYGERAWHPPIRLGNFSIDDPALRRGALGLPIDILLSQARDNRFHVTIATVPRELALAEPAVVERLRRHPDLVSACYHGCEHVGYEFYLTEGRRTRFQPRPLDVQREALARAVEYGRAATARFGLALDRVMVFPYGTGSAAILPELRRLGFIASANYGDKYPLEAPIPEDWDLGLRPADLAWQGYPLLWRRGLADQGYLLDLVLGRPALTFAHLKRLGRDFGPLVERAQALNRAARITWTSLDEIARHAYLHRRAAEGWEALMTADEACLHNPEVAPRRYLVRRPHRPAWCVLEVDGRWRADAAEVEVMVPPMGTTVIRVVGPGPSPALPWRRDCSICGPSEIPRKELAWV